MTDVVSVFPVGEERSDDEIRALCNAATPGPWTVPDDAEPDDAPVIAGEYYLCVSPDDGVRGGHSQADAAFIAAARELVPSLLARVEAAEADSAELRAENEALRASLREQDDATPSARRSADYWLRQTQKAEADLAAAVAKLRAVEALHFTRGRNILDQPVCNECSPLQPMPCPTLRALADPVGLPTTDEPTCEPQKLCEHGWNRAHNELVGPGQLTKVPCPGPTDDERGVAVNASEADRSALFIADDADGDATLWRPNGDYPVPLIRRCDCPPEVWTILAAALADPGGPQADRLRCCPECGFDNNEHNDGCSVAAASPTPEDGKPE